MNLNMIKLFRNLLRVGSPDIKSWGTERAVVELLGDADREWVSLRYRLTLDYIEQTGLVLDAACGSGFGSAILSQKAKMIYGIDISRDAINYAKGKYGKNNIKFSRGDVQKIKFKDDFFDVAIGIETLEHVKHPELYLQELKRVTKNYGKVVISTPQKKGGLLTPYHIYEYDFCEFKELLQKYFKVEEIIGLKRERPPIFEVVTETNPEIFDIYLAVCINIK